MVGRRKVLIFDENKVLKETEGEQLKKNEKENTLEALVMASGLGFSISLPIAGGIILGNILDERFRTSPRISLSLLFLGIIISISNLYMMINRFIKK